jgi:glycosyltransferase involved in cell wall biosynthesis
VPDRVFRVLWLMKGLGLGGAERLLALMAPRLDPERFEVEVAYLLPWKDAFVPELVRAGIRVTCLGARRTIDPRWAVRLRGLLAERRIDLVHTHSPVPAAAARLLVDAQTRVLHTEHNVWDRYRWPTYAANAVTYGRNDAVLAVSDGVAASVRRPRWLPTASYPPVETLLHGVDVDDARRGDDARKRARKRLGLSPDLPVIGNVANLTPKKDHLTLLDALARLRATYPDLVGVIIGTGPLESELRDRADRLQLDQHIRFLGRRDDVLDILPGLDVFVLSSRYEGLPISMLEAMAAEVPCVLTQVGGIAEAVTDGQEGLLVPAAAPEALARALGRVLADPDLRRRLGTAARERVERDFSIGRAVRTLEERYTTLLTSSGGDASPS